MRNLEIAAVAAAQTKANEGAATARTVCQEPLDAGWTAGEITGAGLKPPVPPRKRGANMDAAAAAQPGWSRTIACR